MTAIILVIPILMIRYPLLSALSKDALKRAAFFAPLIGAEKTAYWLYQAATLLILVDLMFLKIRMNSGWFYPGAILYGIGLAFYALSMADFARPKPAGLNVNGLYRLSRNPMYLAYFLCLLGCVLMTRSWTLAALLVIFQAASHWIIHSEERWCVEQFGEEYIRYMAQVRRYL